MILNDVADGARLVVECTPTLHSEVFGHGDLHALDVVAVPERLQERVHEPEEDEILDRPLPEIMVDAEDRRLVEGREQDPVELLCRAEVSAEGLFENDAGALGAARLGELLHDEPEERGRDGKVVCRPLGRAELFADCLKRCRVFVVPVNIAQQAR